MNPSAQAPDTLVLLLRQQEMEGEALANRIRLAYAAAGLVMAQAAAHINTPAANQVFLLQGAALLVVCAGVALLLRQRRGAWLPWLKYLTITVDLAVVHLSVVATTRNHFGAIEYFHAFFPIVLVTWNLLSALRGSVAACLYSAGASAMMGVAVLAWAVGSGAVGVSPVSTWGTSEINVADELLRVAFVSAGGLVAAVLVRIGRKLLLRAAAEERRHAQVQRQNARIARYLDPTLVEALEATPAGPDLGGERRVATTLFVDIRGFTALAADHEPEQVVSLLNRYFSEMVGIVQRNGGTVDKLIGDGLMAVFGAPAPREHAPLRAVLTALDMIAAVDAMNRTRPAGHPALRIGAGIATGVVIAGNIGSAERMDYTVVGPSVNLAARLEALNRPLGASVLICAETRQAIAPWVDARPISPGDGAADLGVHEVFAVDPAALDAGGQAALHAQLREATAATAQAGR